MSPPKLIDQLRTAIRLKHYSLRTEEAYWHWIRRFILFHNKRHPNEMAEAEISDFLSHLAVDLRVAASTQNQALSALLFLYKRSVEEASGLDPGNSTRQTALKTPRGVYQRRGPINSAKPRGDQV